MVAPFPRASRAWRDPEAEGAMQPVLDIVGAIRTIRSESRIAPAAALTVSVRPIASESAAAIAEAAPLIGALSRSTVSLVSDGVRPAQAAHAVTRTAEVFVHLLGVLDLAAERTRLAREIEKAEREIAFLEGKLARPEFVERAPAEVVERERARLGEQQAVREKLSATLAAIA
jgi:valyl-tRNA synthetase